jgi:hypothetical protein
LNASAPVEMIDPNVKEMKFENSLKHKYTVNYLFGEEFDDLMVYLNILYTNKTDAALYDNWSFPSITVMDQFWYENNT